MSILRAARKPLGLAALLLVTSLPVSQLLAVEPQSPPSANTVVQRVSERVFLIRDRPGSPTVFNMIVGAGSADERPGEAGIAHYLEHLITIERLKTRWATRREERNQTPDLAMSELYGWLISDHSYDDYLRVPQRMAAVSPEAVAEVLEGVVRPRACRDRNANSLRQGSETMKPILPHIAATAIALAAVLHPAAGGVEEPRVTIHSTPGGLSFRHVQIATETKQVIAFSWKDGSAFAVASKVGVPTLGVMLMSQGPKGLSASEFGEELKDADADIQLSVDQNHTHGVLVATPNKLTAAADLAARMLTDPALPAEKLEEMKRNYIPSLWPSEGASNLPTILFGRLILGITSHMRFIMVERSTLETVTKEDIETWRRAVLVRDTLVITTAGPLNAEDVAPAIDRLFAGLPQSGSLLARSKPKPRAPSKLIVLEKDVQQTAIVAGNPRTKIIADPDSYLWGLAANDVLGGDSSGRLFVALRDQLGATYGAYSSLLDVDYVTQALFISTSVANDTVGPVIAMLRSEYARFLEQGVTEEELEETKTAFLTNIRASIDNASSMAAALQWVALRDSYPSDYYPAPYARQIRGITRVQVNGEIAASFPKALTIVVVTPSAAGLGADCIIKSLDEIARCEG